jgi:DNA-binding NtrC family response regulator
MERPAVLVVDDHEIDRKLVDRTLIAAGYEVTTASGGEEAIALIRSRLFDAAVVDLRMPGMDGIELLRLIKEHSPVIEVVVMTADPTVDTAVEALKQGAFDYIGKPLNLDELQHLMARLMEKSELRREVKSLRTALGQLVAARELIGTASAMKQLKSLIDRTAPTNSAVLIEGESGTGKELIAAAIHRGSPRAKGPFIPVNCGAIPTNLLESEFFGHVRGSFTGAVSDALGLFRSAHGGTIFLDEVAELPATLQSKLLRVLQDSEVRPVGATKTYTVDVRVVAATNRSLEAAVRDGQLREDLYYRLNVVRLVAPPLRERRADVPALVQHFVRQFNERFNRHVRGITPDALAALGAYDFPGNVRELENLIERAFALGARDEIGLEDLPALAARLPVVGAGALEAGEDLPALDTALSQLERALIVKALQLHGNDRERAARALSISTRTLYRRLSEHRLL